MIGKRPYTPGYLAGDWVILSGQTGRVGETLAPGGFDAQFRQAFANIREILAGHKLGFDALAKITIYLTRMEDDYPRMNELYAQMFGVHKPARTTIGVAALPRGALVEVEAWAYTGQME